MKVWKELHRFKAQNPVVTIGIFDGVHRGHRYLVDKLKKTAGELKGESVVVTLWPHPRMVLQKDTANLRYLTSIDEKILLLKEASIDHLVIIPFTLEFSRLDSCRFIEEYLVERIGIHKLIVGFNHKFGRNREGDFENLKSCARRFNFELERLSPVLFGEEKISSSVIRNLLLNGELEKANRFLGYDFFIDGEVVEGNRLGRRIGFPTANVKPQDAHKLIPMTGVYAVEMEVAGKLHPGMLNVGYRPTVSESLDQQTVEVHLFDFQDDLYGEHVRINFRRFMRNEQKFASLENLKEQLLKDRDMAKDLLN